MKRFLPLLLHLVLSASALAQDPFAPLDLLYPELAQPREEALAAIKKRDFRFITIDRFGKDAPGANKYPRLKRRYGTQFFKQRQRILTTPSQKFSYRIRLRTYAEKYNQTLLEYLLKENP